MLWFNIQIHTSNEWFINILMKKMYSCKDFSCRYFVVTLSVLIQHAKKTDPHTYEDYLMNISVSLQISCCFIVTTILLAGIYLSFFAVFPQCLPLSSLQLSVSLPPQSLNWLPESVVQKRYSLKKGKLYLTYKKNKKETRKELYLQRPFFSATEEKVKLFLFF